MKGAELLRGFLAATGITGAAFAAAIGVDPSAVSHYLAGRRKPDLSTAARIERQTCGTIPASTWVDEGRP